MSTSRAVLLPDEISEIAKKLYREKFREKYENHSRGEFLAIDVINKKEFHGKYPEDALRKARKQEPDGSFYLYRIGESATFHTGHRSEYEKPVDWLV